MTTTETAPSLPALQLRPGLDAAWIDGELRQAVRGLDITNRILSFYLDELSESRKYRDLGYRCLAAYADQRLGIESRRARELCQAGRVLTTLTSIDAACRDGRLGWTKTELLTHGVREHEQDEWLERALASSCRELKEMLQRHRQGLSPERNGDGGLPSSGIHMQVNFSSELATKIESVREDLMRRRGAVVDDDEVLSHFVAEYEIPASNPEKQAERAAACEQGVTPDWLRRDVLARDRHECQACGETEYLHAHHIVFRSHGGPTRIENLVTVCAGCHGLIHEARLFAKRLGPTRVEFRNRFGELLSGSPVPASPPEGFLELLRPAETGGRPPEKSGSTGRFVVTGAKPQFLSLDDIPENPSTKWFLDHVHLLDCTTNGKWTIRKSARR